MSLAPTGGQSIEVSLPSLVAGIFVAHIRQSNDVILRQNKGERGLHYNVYSIRSGIVPRVNNQTADPNA